MLIFVFVFLFPFSDQSLVNGLLNNTCKPRAENIDEVAAQLLAFGDPCHSFPTEIKTAADLCAKYQNLTAEVDVTLASYLVRVGLKSMYNLYAKTVCGLYEENADKMIEFAKEVNSKVDKLNPARERILDMFYALNQVLSDNHICQTRSGFPTISCLVFKWAADTTNELSESSQVIAKQILKKHLSLAAKFIPLKTCANLPPRPTDTRFASIDMNLAIGFNNCVNGLL